MSGADELRGWCQNMELRVMRCIKETQNMHDSSSSGLRQNPNRTRTEPDPLTRTRPDRTGRTVYKWVFWKSLQYIITGENRARTVVEVIPSDFAFQEISHIISTDPNYSRLLLVPPTADFPKDSNIQTLVAWHISWYISPTRHGRYLLFHPTQIGPYNTGPTVVKLQLHL